MVAGAPGSVEVERGALSVVPDWVRVAPVPPGIRTGSYTGMGDGKQQQAFLSCFKWRIPHFCPSDWETSPPPHTAYTPRLWPTRGAFFFFPCRDTHTGNFHFTSKCLFYCFSWLLRDHIMAGEWKVQ